MSSQTDKTGYLARLRGPLAVIALLVVAASAAPLLLRPDGIRRENSPMSLETTAHAHPTPVPTPYVTADPELKDSVFFRKNGQNVNGQTFQVSWEPNKTAQYYRGKAGITIPGPIEYELDTSHWWVGPGQNDFASSAGQGYPVDYCYTITHSSVPPLNTIIQYEQLPMTIVYKVKVEDDEQYGGNNPPSRTNCPIKNVPGSKDEAAEHEVRVTVVPCAATITAFLTSGPGEPSQVFCPGTDVVLTIFIKNNANTAAAFDVTVKAEEGFEEYLPELPYNTTTISISPGGTFGLGQLITPIAPLTPGGELPVKIEVKLAGSDFICAEEELEIQVPQPSCSIEWIEEPSEIPANFTAAFPLEITNHSPCDETFVLRYELDNPDIISSIVAPQEITVPRDNPNTIEEENKTTIMVEITTESDVLRGDITHLDVFLLASREFPSSEVPPTPILATCATSADIEIKCTQLFIHPERDRMPHSLNFDGGCPDTDDTDPPTSDIKGDMAGNILRMFCDDSPLTDGACPRFGVDPKEWVLLYNGHPIANCRYYQGNNYIVYYLDKTKCRFHTIIHINEIPCQVNVQPIGPVHIWRETVYDAASNVVTVRCVVAPVANRADPIDEYLTGYKKSYEGEPTIGPCSDNCYLPGVNCDDNIAP